MMRRILHLLLTLAFSSMHVMGAFVSVEYTHSHADGDHHHHHDHHHGHEHCPGDAPADDDQQEGGDPGQEHTHEISLGSDAPVTVPDFTSMSALSSDSIDSGRQLRDTRPDEPFYGLVKPPQLG